MTKKLTIVVAIAMCVCSVFARPHGGPHGGFGGGHRPPPMMHHGPIHHHHHSAWGRGGSHFWPGFVGGVVGGVVGGAIAPAPVVVTSPTVVPAPVVTSPVYSQQVWVPGGYTTTVVNGYVTRTWVPGHWEYR